MLLTDDAPWPRYFHDGIHRLVYRYDRPTQARPYLRSLSRNPPEATPWWEGGNICTYKTAVSWSKSDNVDAFWRTTQAELIAKYDLTLAFFDCTGALDAAD